MHCICLSIGCSQETPGKMLHIEKHLACEGQILVQPFMVYRKPAKQRNFQNHSKIYRTKLGLSRPLALLSSVLFDHFMQNPVKKIYEASSKFSL